MNIVCILEAALFSAPEPLSIEKMAELFPEENRPSNAEIREALSQLKTTYEERAIELMEVASGFRFQVRIAYAPFIHRLEERKPARYSRSFLETLALIAYRQPITRGEIEDIRGVAVNPAVIKVLLERDWIKIAGYRDVPGKPALLATTKTFLDYFNLKNLSQLPALSELVDFESLEKQLGFQLPEQSTEQLPQLEASETSESSDVSDEKNESDTETTEKKTESELVLEEEVGVL